MVTKLSIHIGCLVELLLQKSSLSDGLLWPLWQTHVVEGSLVPELGPLPAAPALALDGLNVILASEVRVQDQPGHISWQSETLVTSSKQPSPTCPLVPGHPQDRVGVHATPHHHRTTLALQHTRDAQNVLSSCVLATIHGSHVC